MKLFYSKPVLRRHGSVESITAGNGHKVGGNASGNGNGNSSGNGNGNGCNANSNGNHNGFDCS